MTPHGTDLQPDEAVVRQPKSSFDEDAPLPRDKWVTVCEADERSGRVLIGQGGAALPPITVRYQAPNGTYRLKMRVKLDAIWPFVSTRFQMKAQGEAKLKTIEVPRKNCLVDLGTYEVTANLFELTLYPILTSHQFRMGRIVFVPTDAQPPEKELQDLHDSEEKLAAVGYL